MPRALLILHFIAAGVASSKYALILGYHAVISINSSRALNEQVRVVCLFGSLLRYILCNNERVFFVVRMLVKTAHIA
ncbi:hypothetical protein Ancab_012171 [Ancistrocladus abbreviatus]